MNPPPGFTWHRRDEPSLVCESCGEIVKAEVVDLHRCNGGVV